MAPSSFSILPLALFLAITGAQLVLALRALVVELRDGLKPSWARAGAAVLIFALSSVIAVSGDGGPPPLPPLPEPEAPATSTLAPRPEPAIEQEVPAAVPRTNAAAAKRIAALRKERERLFAQLRKIDAELDRLEPSPGPRFSDLSPLPPPPLPDLFVDDVDVVEDSPARLDPVSVVTWLGLLAAAGLGALLLFGDARTLRPGWRRVRRDEKDEHELAMSALDRLAEAAAEGRYDEGLELARQLDASLLSLRERSDLVLLHGLCALHVAAKSSSLDARRTVLQGPVEALRALVEQAPRLHAAGYLLSMGRAALGEHEPALEGFRRLERNLARLELPFDENKSYCLLSLAQQQLTQGDAQAAAKYFEEATALGKLVDRIPILLVEGRMHGLRRSIAAHHLGEAKKGVESLRKVEGLPADQSRLLGIICDAFEVLIAFKEMDDERALELVQGLWGRIVPAGLPAVTDEAADEYLEPAVKASSLPVPPELYRAMLFLEAVVRVRLVAARGRPLEAVEADAISVPLLRALQFEPRHREVLAALGALAFWFLPGKRAKGMEWLEAAVSLGTRSATALRLVEQERAHEEQRKDLLQHFIGVSGRFLSDSTVASQIRRALAEELGRFQDFAPVLLEIEQMVESEQQSPSVQALGERSRYLETLLQDALGRRDLELERTLSPLRDEYRRSLEALEGAAARITQLDGRVLADLGKLILT